MKKSFVLSILVFIIVFSVIFKSGEDDIIPVIVQEEMNQDIIIV